MVRIGSSFIAFGVLFNMFSGVSRSVSLLGRSQGIRSVAAIRWLLLGGLGHAPPLQENFEILGALRRILEAAMVSLNVIVNYHKVIQLLS